MKIFLDAEPRKIHPQLHVAPRTLKLYVWHRPAPSGYENVGISIAHSLEEAKRLTQDSYHGIHAFYGNIRVFSLNAPMGEVFPQPLDL